MSPLAAEPAAHAVCDFKDGWRVTKLVNCSSKSRWAGGGFGAGPKGDSGDKGDPGVMPPAPIPVPGRSRPRVRARPVTPPLESCTRPGVTGDTCVRR